MDYRNPSPKIFAAVPDAVRQLKNLFPEQKKTYTVEFI